MEVIYKPGTATHTCNPSTWGLRQKDCWDFKTSLGSRARFVSKTQQRWEGGRHESQPGRTAPHRPEAKKSRLSLELEDLKCDSGWQIRASGEGGQDSFRALQAKARGFVLKPVVWGPLIPCLLL